MTLNLSLIFLQLILTLISHYFSLFFVLVVFPQDLLERGLGASNFAMLGLGDIVIPGKYMKMISETLSHV